jgi:hypothetical protein
MVSQVRVHGVHFSHLVSVMLYRLLHGQGMRLQTVFLVQRVSSRRHAGADSGKQCILHVCAVQALGWVQGLNLEVPAGTSCAIVGTSGSGKSTIMRLLFRLFDSTSGQIRINDSDIKQVTTLLATPTPAYPPPTLLSNFKQVCLIVYPLRGTPTAASRTFFVTPGQDLVYI